MRPDLALIAGALMVIAGALACGLGQIAQGTSYGSNFAIVFGGGIMAVGCLVFVLMLFFPGSSGPKE